MFDSDTQRRQLDFGPEIRHFLNVVKINAAIGVTVCTFVTTFP